jgi:hypothetical protein
MDIEHHAIYQVNYYHAKNVFVGLQQSEVAPWQIGGSTASPAPWGDYLLPSDPDYSWCNTTDAQVWSISAATSSN